MPDWDVRLKKMPSPEIASATDVDTRVRLSHWGDVSRRLCFGGCTVCLPLNFKVTRLVFEIACA